MLSTSVPDKLQNKINNKIAVVAAIAPEMPGVVIIHDLRDWSVAWMSERGLQLLGLSLAEVTSLTMDEYHSRFFNPEDAKEYVPQILNLLKKNNDEEICSFLQQVRFTGAQHWTWHLSSIKILLRDYEEKPLLTITIAIPVQAMHHMTAKADRLLEENNFLRKHYSQFATLTTREQDILRWLALGKSAPETAEILSIAVTTVETHRKNIKQKLDTTSFYNLCQYARAFDLI